MELFVPGRICLFGEHSDWAGGYRRINSKIEQGFTIITGTNQGLFARVSKRPGRLVFKTLLADGNVKTLDEPMESGRLLEIAESGGFFAYIAGVAYQVLTHYHVDGIEIDNYKTTLPVRKGLSSSAAVCVLTARAFNRLYDLKMTVRGEMEMAYRGEITTPSRCGRMDQGCAYGERPILMRFDGDSLDVKELFVSRPLHYLIVDLKSRKDTVKILADLNRAYPFAETEAHRAVQECLGAVNKKIVADARSAIESGADADLGKLMAEAQNRFDESMQPVCPEELTSPVLHRLLEAVRTRPDLAGLVLGAKGVGSQGDGTAQLLVRDETAQSAVAEVLERDLGVECLPLSVPATKKVRKAVITAAGHGTRLFPLTKITRKEFMPVIDSSGRLSPLIVDHVLSAIAAGIDDIALIIQKDEEPIFRRLFCDPVPPEVFAKLSDENKERARQLEAAGSRLTFIHQKAQKGLGHALLGTKEWIGDQPFLLILGDHYFTSTGKSDCYSQIIDSYGSVGDSLIGLAETHEAEIHRFGTVAGKWDSEEKAGPSVFSITELKEKPDIDYARENLRVDGLPEGRYFTVFGLYILPSRVFTLLADMEAAGEYERGELQLTGALDQLRAEQGMLGIPIEGTKIDIGVPAEYVNAFRSV